MHSKSHCFFIGVAGLLTTVSGAHAASPGVDSGERMALFQSWIDQSTAFEPACAAFDRELRAALPSPNKRATTAQVEHLAQVLAAYPGVPAATQALVRELLAGAPDHDDQAAYQSTVCSLHMYLSGMQAVLTVVPQLPPGALLHKLRRLAFLKAAHDLAEPAPTLAVMVHADILKQLADAGLLSVEATRTARQLHASAEAARASLTARAYPDNDGVRHELQSMEGVRRSLWRFASDALTQDTTDETLFCMRPGDSLRRVDGQQIDSPDAALDVYAKIRCASMIAVEVQRGAQIVQYSCRQPGC